MRTITLKTLAIVLLISLFLTGVAIALSSTNSSNDLQRSSEPLDNLAEATTRGYVLDAQGAVLPESFLFEAGLASLVDERLAVGNSIQLTLDSALQKAAEGSLAKALDSQPNVLGAVVVMDMEGRILALADNEERESGMTVPFAFSARATPGRTLLPLSALAALSSDAIVVEERISDWGLFDLYEKGSGPRCWIDPSRLDLHENLTVVDALSNGCDYFFFTAASRTGSERWAAMTRALGLDNPSGIGLPGEVPGVVASPEALIGTRLVETAVGRSDTQVTPIAMARYWTALANGGYVYDARLMEEASAKPEPAADLSGIIGAYLPFIKEGLHGVLDVSGESAPSFSGWPYPLQVSCMIAVGKSAESGTQQATWAVGFAPHEKPEITVVVFLPSADFSKLAGTIFRDVMDAYLNRQFDPSSAEQQPDAASLSPSAEPRTREERTTIIGFLGSPEDANREENTLYLRTYYLGSFIIKLPKDASIDDVLAYVDIKVTLEEPRVKMQNVGNVGSPVNAIKIEGVPFMTGKLIKQTDNYMDIEIWTFSHDSEREGQTQRVVLNDTPFTRPFQIGEDVYIAYEIDEEGNTVALLISGFVG